MEGDHVARGDLTCVTSSKDVLKTISEHGADVAQGQVGQDAKLQSNQDSIQYGLLYCHNSDVVDAQCTHFTVALFQSRKNSRDA